MTKQYKSGNEFLPFHPQASHVSPDYRDGWNACWQAAIASRDPMPLEKAEEIAHRTASRYTHKSDRSFAAYTFLPNTLEDFVRKLEKHHGVG